MIANKILLIDDDKEVLRSLENVLKKQGYNVSAVDSGSKGIEIAQKENFDLIITDIRMPNFNGIETIKRIKEYQESAKGKKSEFMIITGYAEDDAPKESALLGITNFVLKPFDLGVFLDTIKNCLTGKKSEISKEQEIDATTKTKIKLSNKYFLLEKIIFLKDTNLMGNTYFSNYVLWQGEAREAYLMTHPNFREEMQKNQYTKMITHSLYHRFIQETTLGDMVQIKMNTRELKHCSFVIVFKYYNKLTNDFLGEGWQRITFSDVRTGNLTTIPAFIKELALAIKED